MNTVQLIRDIKAMMGDDRAVEVELPEKPRKDMGRYISKKPEYGQKKTVRNIMETGNNCNSREMLCRLKIMLLQIVLALSQL